MGGVRPNGAHRDRQGTSGFLYVLLLTLPQHLNALQGVWQFKASTDSRGTIGKDATDLHGGQLLSSSSAKLASLLSSLPAFPDINIY